MKIVNLKPNLKTLQKKGVHYILTEKQRIKKFKPWLGDMFCFVYDKSMEKTVFPKKFGGDINRHYEILRKQMEGIHGKTILELGTGSGNAVYFLNRDNYYTGIDVSAGLLRRAVKRFREFGFEKAQCYVSSADDLPFADKQFDIVMCHLSLNFFPDIHKALQKLQRIMRSGATVYCSIPVPEREGSKSTIHGKLYTEVEYAEIFKKYDLNFESLPDRNGNLLYFKANL